MSDNWWTVTFTFTDGTQCTEETGASTTTYAIERAFLNISYWEWRQLEATHGRLVKVEVEELKHDDA